MYMSILTFLVESFVLILSIPFSMCMHERPTEYEIMYTYIPYYIYIYMNGVFCISLTSLKSSKFSSLFSKVTFLDLAKQPHDYQHVPCQDPGMLQLVLEQVF